MPKILLFLLILLMASPVFAKDDDEKQETLFRGKAEKGLYFGPSLKVSRVGGDIVYFAGFRGVLLINHTHAYGYGSYGMGGEITAPSAARTFYATPAQPRTGLELDFSYGGIEYEYIHNWTELFHWGLYTLIGSGTIRLGDPEDRNFSLSDKVFVLAPALTGMLNLTRRFTAAAEVSYRYVADVDLAGVNLSDLRGPSVGVELRFGKF